jgi:hypothetical protein
LPGQQQLGRQIRTDLIKRPRVWNSLTNSSAIGPTGGVAGVGLVDGLGLLGEPVPDRRT